MDQRPRTITENSVTDISAHIDVDDDMFDDPADIQSSEILSHALQHWGQIADCYWKANSRAIRLQKRHRRVVNAAVCFGTAAVIFAIVQLPLLYSRRPSGRWLMMAEFLASLTAALSVFWGLKSALHHHWLLERHKAEQVRLLKYRSLLELAESPHVDAQLQEWKDRLRHSVQQIEHLDRSHVRKWLGGENRLSYAPERTGKSRLPDKYLKSLVDYYGRRRLDAQIAYFLEKAESEHERDWVTRLLPPMFFLVGIGFACAHFMLDLVIALLEKRRMVTSPDWQHSVSLTLIEAAAIFPVLGSAIRTYRSAHESSRNTTRFRAASIELERLSERLQMETDPAAIVGDLRRCEEILDVEHRDWLRLMTEAEWFG